MAASKVLAFKLEIVLSVGVELDVVDVSGYILDDGRNGGIR